MKRLRLAFLLSVLMVVSSSPTFADIYSANDPSIKPTAGHYVTGTGNVTIDTSTSLAWLDLTLSTNMSYNETIAQLQPGGCFEGYRFASPGDLGKFWGNAGFHGYYEGDYTPAMNVLQGLWGATEYTEQHQTNWSYAMNSSGHGFGTHSVGFIENRTELYANDSVETYYGPAMYGDDRDPTIGMALVRPASEVPEPSSFALATLGLLGGCGVVFGLRRRGAATV